MPTPPTLTALQQNVLNYLTDHLRAGNTPPTLHYQEVKMGADPDFNPRDRHFRRISKALHKINQHEAYYKRPSPGHGAVLAMTSPAEVSTRPRWRPAEFLTAPMRSNSGTRNLPP